MWGCALGPLEASAIGGKTPAPDGKVTSSYPARKWIWQAIFLCLGLAAPQIK